MYLLVRGFGCRRRQMCNHASADVGIATCGTLGLATRGLRAKTPSSHTSHRATIRDLFSDRCSSPMGVPPRSVVLNAPKFNGRILSREEQLIPALAHPPAGSKPCLPPLQTSIGTAGPRISGAATCRHQTAADQKSVTGLPACHTCSVCG